LKAGALSSVNIEIEEPLAALLHQAAGMNRLKAP
jgi:hypothetical protein